MKIYTILSNLSFIDSNLLKIKEMKEIKEIRNQNSVRKNMFTDHIISDSEHQIWQKKLATSKDEKFFGVKYQDKIIGGLGLKDIKKSNAYWSFYISENDKILGMGAILEFKALDFFFNKFRFKKISCYVLKKNYEVIKLHKKFGFSEIFNKDLLNIKYHNKDEIRSFELSINKWKTVKSNFEKKYLK